MTDERTLQRLADTLEIQALQARYARAVDRLDMDLLREVYHPDAYDDHGDYKGGVDGLLAYVEQRTGSALQVMHFLGQTLIDFASPQAAACETYFMTAHTLDASLREAFGASPGPDPVQISMYGRYVDRVEKRDGQWRIARRTCVFESTRLFTDKYPPIKPDWAQLSRGDGKDPIFRLITELKTEY
ncbi:nuclear transport factor 2 family protein [Nocardia nova]|uniref:nuclear transport factor 2 family protein n=1 Tax=Nocardia nova TaxID=37330 RepID=UPI00340C2632